MSRNTGKVETATVTEQIARVQLKEGNKVLWEAASLKGAPIFVHHGKNESLQSAINKEEQKQDVGFFSQVQLPQYLARGGEYGVYGASKLTVDGIEDVPIASLYNGPTPVGAPGASHGAGPGMPGRSGPHRQQRTLNVGGFPKPLVRRSPFSNLTATGISFVRFARCWSV